MTISRSQQPRQMYGLGSLVKSVKKAVKNVVKSPIGKAAILGFGLGGGFSPAGFKFGTFGSRLGLGTLTGGEENIFAGGPFSGIANLVRDKYSSMGAGSKLAALGIGGASILSGLFAGKSEEEIAELKRNPETLKVYLRDYYTKLNPKASSEEIDAFVTTNTSEYYATGGRVGYAIGGPGIQVGGPPPLGSPQGGTSLYGDVLEYLKRGGKKAEGALPKQVMMDDMGEAMPAYSGAGSSGGITGASTTPISTGGGSSGTGILQATPGATQSTTTSPSNVAPSIPEPDAQLQKEFQNLYDLHKDYLAELNNNMYTKRKTFYEIPNIRSIDIDEEIEFVYAEFLLEKGYVK